jgi:hypothetical protein
MFPPWPILERAIGIGVVAAEQPAVPPAETEIYNVTSQGKM